MTSKHLNPRGFSSLELICCISIVSIVLYTGLLNYPEFRRSFNQSNVYTQLQQDLRRAKNEALQKGAMVYLSPGAGSNSYSVGVDYLPYNGDGSVDEHIFARSFPTGFTANFSSDVVFDSRGAIKNDWGGYGFVSIHLTNDTGNAFAWGFVYGAGMIQMYGYH